MDKNQAMYVAEHVLIPDWFYGGKRSFVWELLLDKTLLSQKIKKIFDNNDIAFPYSGEDFKAEILPAGEGTDMLKITFPEPEDGLCSAGYFLFDKAYEKTWYFCLEKYGDSDEPYLCSWSPDGQHTVYGACSPEANEDILFVKHYFLMHTG